MMNLNFSWFYIVLGFFLMLSVNGTGKFYPTPTRLSISNFGNFDFKRYFRGMQLFHLCIQ